MRGEDFTDIYNNYGNDVFRYILSLCKNEELAKDLTQETFYRAIKNINGFNGKSPIFTWICAIGKNLYVDYIRKSKRTIYKEGNDDVDNRSPEVIYSEKDSSKRIVKAIESFDEPTKTILKLHLLDGISLKNISAICNKSESYARVMFYRGKLKLREVLLEDEEGV